MAHAQNAWEFAQASWQPSRKPLEVFWVSVTWGGMAEQFQKGACHPARCLVGPFQGTALLLT
jgi:hypothetical protein